MFGRRLTLPFALSGLAVAAVAIVIGGGGGSPALGQSGGPFLVRAPYLAADSVPSTPTPPLPDPESFEVIFFDVGQGDASLVTVGGERLLIDAGGDGTLIRARLVAWGIDDLDAILATHIDPDHIGGFAAVLEEFEVETVYLNGETSESQEFLDFMAAVDAEGAEVVVLERGDTIPLGGTSMPVLNPPASLSGVSNDNSIVTQLTCDSIDVLFTGDVEAAAEASMIAAGLIGDVDIVKLANHGSNTSTTAAFLSQASPRWAVISAGIENSEGYPDPEVLDRLTAGLTRLQYTDLAVGDDTLVLTSDCRTYEFSREPVEDLAP